MVVKDLIDLLSKLDPDSLVVLAKDEEGNGFSPLAGVESTRYTAANTWSGYTQDSTASGAQQVILGNPGYQDSESVPAVANERDKAVQKVSELSAKLESVEKENVRLTGELARSMREVNGTELTDDKSYLRSRIKELENICDEQSALYNRLEHIHSDCPREIAGDFLEPDMMVWIDCQDSGSWFSGKEIMEGFRPSEYDRYIVKRSSSRAETLTSADPLTIDNNDITVTCEDSCDISPCPVNSPCGEDDKPSTPAEPHGEGYLYVTIVLHNGAEAMAKRSPNGIWWWESLPASGPDHKKYGTWNELLDHYGRSLPINVVVLRPARDEAAADLIETLIADCRECHEERERLTELCRLRDEDCDELRKQLVDQDLHFTRAKDQLSNNEDAVGELEERLYRLKEEELRPAIELITLNTELLVKLRQGIKGIQSILRYRLENQHIPREELKFVLELLEALAIS